MATTGKGAAAAQTELANEAVIAAVTNDFETARSHAMVAIDLLGQAAARGQASMTALAIEFGTMVATKIMTGADAAIVYARYVAAHNGALKFGANPIASDEKSVKPMISNLATFAARGPAQIGETLWRQVIEVRSTIPATDRLHNSAFNALVTVNRKVRDASKDVLVASVSDAEIKAWISKPVSVEKSEEDKLIELIGKLVKRSEKDEWLSSGLDKLCEPLVSFATKLKATGKAPTVSTVVH